jgi:hypothetical protein
VWNGYTYWAFSYVDNRYSFGIVAYDPSGRVVKQWEKTGSRYIWKITVNESAKTVTFYGQTTTSVTMTYQELTLPPLSTFPGGAPITPADLTATPAQFPAPPPKYNPSTNSPTHTEFARFAWRNFIYLNSPAKPASFSGKGQTTVVRGNIDPNRNFVASGGKTFYQSGQTTTSNFSKNILVWESFAHRTELLPKLSGKLPNFQTAAPTYRYQILTVPATNARFNHLDENSQIAQNVIFFPKNGSTPSKNPFDDYQILFEAKVNQAEYDYVNTFFGTAPSSIELPPNSIFKSDSIEIKAAWRVLTQAMIDSGRYHTAEAIYYTGTDEDPEPQVGVFGLIGLHIIRKMENYPTFVYATFEHVDNLVKPDGTPSGVYFLTTYTSLAYDSATGTSPSAIINNGGSSAIKVALPRSGSVVSGNGYKFIPGTYTIPAGMAGPIAVVQPPTITSDVVQVNKEVKAAMASSGQFANSVWQYYELKGIQAIPTNEQSATGPLSPATKDFYLANNVVESSQPGVQLFKGATDGPTSGVFTNERASANIINVPNTPQVNMGGCMGCHGRAIYNNDNSIFNFLMINKNRLMGKGYKNPDAVGAQSGDAMQERADGYFETGVIVKQKKKKKKK